VEPVNRKLEEQEFLAMRREVLALWPSGQEVDLEDAIDYHKKLGDAHNVAETLRTANRDGRTLCALRAGIPTVEGQIDHLQCVEKAGAELLPVTADSYTRNKRFQEIETLLQDIRQGGAKLNGFPAVNHGVKKCRQITEAVNHPITLKHGSVDPRLLAEVAFASGFSDLNGNVFSWGLTYNKNVPLDAIMANQQYVDRLAGYYTEHGVTIAREQGGGQGPGCFRLPCISLSNTILGGLISVGQGVKATQIANGQGTNLVQDVASLRVLRKLGMEYFQRLGHEDVLVTTMLHQWQGVFPVDPNQAMGIICLGAMEAVLGGADQVVIKSTQEGVGVPSKEANAGAVLATKQVMQVLGSQRLPDSAELLEEMEILELETRAIIDTTLDLGQGDPVAGSLKAIAAGVIEVPFTPSVYNAGKAIAVRDLDGAFRFLDPGNMPFPQRVLDFHRQRLARRASQGKKKKAYEMVLEDVYAMCEGLVGKELESRGGLRQ
jgi:methylaspartate mutase epsilon subunit